MEEINSTPSWQQSSQAHTDDNKHPQAQFEGKKVLNDYFRRK